MRLNPLVCLDLSNFTTFAESLGWQGFQVTFQMSSKERFGVLNAPYHQSSPANSTS